MQTVQNNFNNHSGPGGNINPGNNGKFSASQTEERLRVHAKSIATGSPTIPQIVEYWKERFGIDIALQTEKTWRQSNKERIERMKMTLIEAGEIKVPVVSEEVLSDTMLELAIKTSGVSKALRRKIRTLVETIDLRCEGSSEDRARNLEKVKILTDLTNALAKTDKGLKEEIDSLFAFSSKIKIKDKEIQKIVDQKFDDKMKKSNEEDSDDEDEALEGKVFTDEMRNKLLEA